MSIGERLKIARRSAGLSQRALAERAGVSAMAISKYERNQDTPSSAVLLRLAGALGIKVEYFFRPITVTLTPSSYRCRTSLSHKQKEAIWGQVQEWLERYLEVESLFNRAPDFTLPPDFDRHVSSLDEVERVTLDLRQAWHLGIDPLESLVEVLEDRGIKVGLVNGHNKFDALILWANGKIPVIVVKRNLPGDRQRFSLAHELGHVILEPIGDVDAEKAAHRFAAAFLVPEPAARFELGHQRHMLGIRELLLLKHKYGLSMQAWIYRAKDLGIISESVATKLFKQFHEKGWHQREPGAQIPPEKPGRMKRLVMRALAEDIISRSRAAELLGIPLGQLWQEEAKQYDRTPFSVRC